MILSEFTGDQRPRTQIRPKLIAKTSKKAKKGACRRPTKMHPLTNIEIAANHQSEVPSKMPYAGENLGGFNFQLKM